MTFASIAPGLEIAKSQDEAIQAVEDVVDNLRDEYQEWRRDLKAELLHLQLSQTNPRLLDLTLVRKFDALNLPERRCVVTKQCLRRNKFCDGPAREDFAMGNVVVVAFLIFYRCAKFEQPDRLDLNGVRIPAVAEVLFLDVNGHALEYVGRAPIPGEETIVLANESWLQAEKNSTEENIRNAVLRHRYNNCFIAGWNIGLFFTTLNTAVPEWTLIDLAADPYVRKYLHDVVEHRGIDGHLFDTNIWYPADRRWLAIYGFEDSCVELWSARAGEATLRRNVTRESLFTAAAVRLFFRPMHRRYEERYLDVVYKLMVCGHGSTVKALAVANPRLLDITSPEIVSKLHIGDEPKDLAKFISQFRNDGGEVAEWCADPTLKEFVARCADLPFVRRGFSDDAA